MGKKVCTKCGIEKPITDFGFYRFQKGVEKRLAQCKACRQNNQSKWIKSNRKRVSAQNRQYRMNVKKETFAAYGGKCECYGESNLAFLMLDHPNDDGAAQRKALGFIPGKVANGVGIHLYRLLKKQGFPKTFRILCFNCNCGRRVNGGRCPHEDFNVMTMVSGCGESEVPIAA